MSDHVDNLGAMPDGMGDLSFSFEHELDALYTLEQARPTSQTQAALEHPEDASFAPSSSQQTSLERPRNWRRDHKLSNQFIWKTFCPRLECFTATGFLSNHNAVVTLDHVLISTMYYGSYMWEDTLRYLGYEPTYARTRRTVNPRGGRFKPIGVFFLYIWPNGPDPIPPVPIEFYVLPGSPAESGVDFILGKPDIKRIWGDEWTPEQHMERMARLDAGVGV